MADDPDPPEKPRKSRLPPPDLARKPPPPPSPPIFEDKAAPLPPPSAPPLKVSVDPKSTEHDVDRDPVPLSERPGADAGMPNRVIATFIDFVIAAGIYFGADWVLPGFLERSAYLLGIAYLVTRDALPFLDGQSVGKKAMKIQAVSADGKPLTGDWQPCLIRNAVLLIPFFALVELFVLISRQEGPKPLLRLGDEWAGTKVVNAGMDNDDADSGTEETPEIDGKADSSGVDA